MNRITPEALYGLLPAIHRLRDAEENESLRQFISVLAREGAVVEENIEQLLDNLFIETCADWAAPYIGGTIGYQPLYELEDLPVGNRAEVANTISYRRRKGTAAVLEQLARDVTGWPARVVEYFQLVATCQHMNHIRPDHHASPDLHNPRALEDLGEAFDKVTRTIDVRSIQQTSGRLSVGGRHNLPNIGLHLWRLQTLSHHNVPTTRVGPRRFLFDPLGAPRQLVNPPEPESSITSIAQPVHVPHPITRRKLAEDVTSYYPRAFEILVDGVSQPVEEIEACDLSNAGANWNHSPHGSDDGGDIRIDPELGRIAFRNGNPGDVRVTFHSAFPALIGGGEYNREAGIRTNPGETVDTVEAPVDLTNIVATRAAEGGVLEFTTNDIFSLPSMISVGEGRELVIRAADGFRPIIRMTEPLILSGGSDARITIDGCVFEGAPLRIEPNGDGASLTEVTFRHSTLLPGLSFTRRGTPANPGADSLIVEATGVELTLDRCIAGPLAMSDTTNVSIRDSIVDAAAEDPVDSPSGTAISGLTAGEAAGALTIEESTIVGRIRALSFPLVSNSILFADGDGNPPVQALRRQTGCMRFSFVPRNSITPRRYRCQPQLAIDTATAEAEEQALVPLTQAERNAIARGVARQIRPVFTALAAARPAYAQLAETTPQQISEGASDESEMGVYHHLFQPQRETNLRVRLQEYLRFGLEAGLFYET